MLIVPIMLGDNLIILIEIFPIHHEKILELMGSNSDLQSIIQDVFECRQVLANRLTINPNDPVPREYWEELYEDLKKEAIDLVNREMT